MDEVCGFAMTNDSFGILVIVMLIRCVDQRHCENDWRQRRWFDGSGSKSPAKLTTVAEICGGSVECGFWRKRWCWIC